MRAAARTLTRMYDEAFRPLGLKTTQFTLLSMIIGMKPKSVSQLAKAAAMDRTSLVRNLSVLEKNGWIAIGEEGFRRERKICITPEGTALIEDAWPRWEAVQTKFEQQTGLKKWDENKGWLMEIAKLDDSAATPAE